MKKYNKLVRDNIPDIIKNEGKKLTYRVLDDKEYKIELDKKLQEEVREYLQDNNVEELADIVEVIYGILKSMNISTEQFNEIRTKKVEKRGAFDKKIFLDSAE